ncbi:acyltransferase domain-containing protein, partial [Streptomyces sp. 5-10]|nr:acyltransferase domain-containing protein [Streptomyces sp. 5-10]
GGAMVAVQASEDEVAPLLNERVSIAALNGPSSVVIAGDEDVALEIAAGFEAQGRKTKRLTVSHAFHSPRMDGMLDAFREVAEGLSYEAPRIPIVSNLTGGVVSAEEITTPGLLGAPRPRGRPLPRRCADAGSRGRDDLRRARPRWRPLRDGAGVPDGLRVRRRVRRHVAEGACRGRVRDHRPRPAACPGPLPGLGRLLRGRRGPAGRAADLRLPAHPVLVGGGPGGGGRAGRCRRRAVLGGGGARGCGRAGGGARGGSGGFAG